jgi:hypothetical protein
MGAISQVRGQEGEKILPYPKAFMAWRLCTLLFVFILEISLNNELSRHAFCYFIKESDEAHSYCARPLHSDIVIEPTYMLENVT